MTTPATMYDSTNPAALPPAELYLGYIDAGYPANAAEISALHPGAVVVPVTSTPGGTPGTRVYDCEEGNGDAAQAAGWAGREIAAGRRPTIYCERVGTAGYGWPSVRVQLAARGIATSAVDFGIADWTDEAHLVAGSAFTQYAHPPGSGGDFDVSLTDGVWPGSPAPGPPQEGEEEPMVQYEQGGQTHIVVYQADKNRTVHYWQASPGTAPAGAPPDYYDWHSEVLTEPA
jgi:hypothetical protein